MSKYIAEVGYIHAFSCSRKIKLKIEAHCQIEIIKWHPCGIHLDYILRIFCSTLHPSSFLLSERISRESFCFKASLGFLAALPVKTGAGVCVLFSTPLVSGQSTWALETVHGADLLRAGISFFT